MFSLREGRVVFDALPTSPSSEADVTYRVSNATGAASEAVLRVAVTAAPVEAEAPAWSATVLYRKGDIVTYAGKTLHAQWSTKNQVPGASPYSAWAEKGVVVLCGGESYLTWTNSWIYTAGETVVHNGQRYQARVRG